MKKLLLFTIGLLFSVTAISQRVGVGTVTPSHYFHVLPPAGSGDPVRIEGLQAFNSETDVLVVDPTSGVIRTLPFQQLLDMDTVYFNDTSYMLITDSILADTIFLDSLINLIGDSINTDDQNIDSLTIVGTILTVYIEDGNSASINIQNSVDSLIFAKSDTLYSIIADSALNDTLWIRQLDSLLGIYGDTIFFNDTSYSLIKDSLLKDSLFLDSLIGLIGDSINTDDQNIDSVRLNGTILTVYIEDGNSANIDLQPIVDSALANVPAGSDDQMLTLGVGTATTSIIDIESSASDITIQEGPGIQLTEAGNTLTITGDQDIDSVTLNGTDLRVYIENGLSANVDLQPIVDSALANMPAGSDDQNIDSVTLTGNILEVYIENGTSATVDLSSLNNTGTDDQNIDSVVLTGNILEVFIENGASATVDLSSLNNTGTDDQNIDSLRLNGTILTTYIENGTFANIDLQPIIDSAISNSTGTDDQQVDNFSLSGTTLTLEIENDGQPAHTVNLASLQDGTGTDDQNIDSVTLVGTNLTVYIENGSSATVDVSSLSGTGTDDQNIDSIRLNGTILTTYIENGLSANIDLQPIIDSALANSQDNDWDINGNGTGLEGNPGTNVASGNYSLSAGGNNTASGNYSTTLGGLNNNASSAFSSITGGANNNASGNYSAILGGASNTASGTRSLVFGNSSRAIHTGAAADDFSVAIGSSDSAVGNRSVVIGSRNTALGINSVIFGFSNKSFTSGYNSFIGGGTYHTITGNGSVILGGTTSTSNGVNSFIGAGLLNQTNGTRSAIIGGNENVTLGNNSAVIGGTRDTAFSAYETVLGGFSDGYTASSTNLVVPTDRLLVVGNGTSTAARSNALILYKDGSLEINEAYTLPNVDGGVNQVLQTNGSGVVSWATVSAGGTDDQNIDSLRLNGTILTTYIESGASANIDLQPIIDSAVANASSGADNDWDINGNGTGLEGNPGTNTASGTNSIAAGDGNLAQGNYAIALGRNDTANRVYSSVLGGLRNLSNADTSSVLGGVDNKIANVGYTNVIVHGSKNSISGGRLSAIVSGESNTISSGTGAIIAGGTQNSINSNGGTISGGGQNQINGNQGTVSGGVRNMANATYSSVSGGAGNEAQSYGEWVGGLYATNYVPSSINAWIGTDRLFVVGNGTGLAARSNALTLYKDGSLEINEAYTLPNVDGGVNQVLQTNGSGVVSWATVSAGGTDDQNIDSLRLNGTILTTYIESGASANIDLQPIIDSAVANASSGADNDWDINGNGTGLEGAPGVNTASGTNAIAAGDGNLASGGFSVTFGQNDTASGSESVAIGIENTATSNFSLSIGGGKNKSNGTYSSILGGEDNIVSSIANHSTVAGGGGNLANESYTVISGGQSNQINGEYGAISGGRANVISGVGSSIGGGDNNSINGNRSVIAGGLNMTINGGNSVIGGGDDHDVLQAYSSVLGGQNNNVTTNAPYSSISGGQNNTADASFSTVSGGRGNTAESYGEWVGGLYATTYAPTSTAAWIGTDRLFVVGNGTSTAARSNALTLYKDGSLEINEAYTLPNTDGGANQVLRTDGSGNVSWANVSGGADSDWDINGNGTGLEGNPGTNTASGAYAKSSGSSTVASGDYSVVHGYQSAATGNYSVAFGQRDSASGLNSTVSGGWFDAATGDYSTVGGGRMNKARDYASTVSGGTGNEISSGLYSTISGGANNIVSESQVSVIGGSNNNASGFTSTILGGIYNNTPGDYSTSQGSYNTAHSFHEWVGGRYATDYVPNSATGWNSNDRLFVIGNGTSGAARSNALVLFKNGRLEINEAYTLPNTDGGANQVLRTDGSGNVSWANVSGGADSDWDINGNGTGLEGTPGVNNASGTNSIAAGDGNNAAGDYSVALGQNNNSPGVNSVSLGTQNTSSGPISMTWGAQNTASGDRATAWGRSSTASAIYSTAFGNANTASGDRSTAWGSGTIASGESSTANGVGNEAFSFGEFVTGTYATNYIPNSPGSYNANDRVFVVGNGSGTAARSNGLTLYKDGSLEINEAYTLPNADGGANQVLTTDGAGNVSWQNGISALPTLASGTYSPTVTEISASVTSVSGLTHQYMRIGNHVHVVGRVQVDWNADGNGFVYVTLPIASDFTLATEDVNGSITELRSGPYGTFNNTYQLQANTGSDLIWLQLQNADGALTKYYQYSLMYIIK